MGACMLFLRVGWGYGMGASRYFERGRGDYGGWRGIGGAGSSASRGVRVMGGGEEELVCIVLKYVAKR